MNLIDQLKRDEGCELKVYRDNEGILTAGYGHNCEAHGLDVKEGDPITQEQADMWLLQDAAFASRYLDEHLPWAKSLDTARHDALVNMTFNLQGRLLGFHRMLTFLEDGKWDAAADEALASKWAKQVGDRAVRLAKQIQSGESQ